MNYISQEVFSVEKTLKVIAKELRLIRIELEKRNRPVEIETPQAEVSLNDVVAKIKAEITT